MNIINNKKKPNNDKLTELGWPSVTVSTKTNEGYSRSRGLYAQKKKENKEMSLIEKAQLVTQWVVNNEPLKNEVYNFFDAKPGDFVSLDEWVDDYGYLQDFGLEPLEKSDVIDTEVMEWLMTAEKNEITARSFVRKFNWWANYEPSLHDWPCFDAMSIWKKIHCSNHYLNPVLIESFLNGFIDGDDEADEKSLLLMLPELYPQLVTEFDDFDMSWYADIMDNHFQGTIIQWEHKELGVSFVLIGKVNSCSDIFHDLDTCSMVVLSPNVDNNTIDKLIEYLKKKDLDTILSVQNDVSHLHPMVGYSLNKLLEFDKAEGKHIIGSDEYSDMCKEILDDLMNK